MDKVMVHIGLALLAIKGICEVNTECDNCPLADFCYVDAFYDTPSKWNPEIFPSAIVALTMGEEE